MASLNERLIQRRGIETRPLPQGALLVDMETGRCYRLNRVGAEIWELLRRPLAVGEVCAAVAQKYERDAEAVDRDVREDVLEHLAHLARERLVEAALEGGPP
jgi:hypothetical protein